MIRIEINAVYLFNELYPLDTGAALGVPGAPSTPGGGGT
jgi:hypothetical protein